MQGVWQGGGDVVVGLVWVVGLGMVVGLVWGRWAREAMLLLY